MHESDTDRDMVPGRKPVLELLQREPQGVESVFVSRSAHGAATSQIIDICRRHGIRFQLLERAEMDRMFPGNHQGVVARTFSGGFVELAELVSQAPQAPLPLVVILDQVQDPGNVGALARTLYALGGAGIVVARHHAARLGGAAVRASAGALLRLPVARVTNIGQSLDDFLEAGFEVCCTAAGPDSQSLFDWEPEFPVALVLGNEEKGVRPNVTKRCSRSLAIPMARDFDSLNVAQAGAMAIGRVAERHLAALAKKS